MLAELVRERGGDGYVSPLLIALIHCGLGETDPAFEWLEHAIGERAHWLVFLGDDPRFDPIANDPRFKGLLDQIARGG